VKPRQPLLLKGTRTDIGPSKLLTKANFPRHLPRSGTIPSVAIEQDHAMNGPHRLQRLDLFTDNDKELATLDGYEGGISVSPSGKKKWPIH